MTKGIYNIAIGAGVQMSGVFDETAFSGDRWLLVKVSNETLTPPIPFRYVAHSFRSKISDTCLNLCNDGDIVGCYEGPTGTFNVGTCKAGQRICSGGQYGSCLGATEPVPEICNDQDDDCNGSIDDAPPGASGCTTYYYDADGDGYGDNTDSGTCLCSSFGQPAQTSENNTDCDDWNADVSPGQVFYFTTPYGTNNFDYNCDGFEQKEITQTFLGCYNPSCSSHQGWSGAVPDCGLSGDYINCQVNNGFCLGQHSTKTQGCQ